MRSWIRQTTRRSSATRSVQGVAAHAGNAAFAASMATAACVASPGLESAEQRARVDWTFHIEPLFPTLIVTADQHRVLGTEKASHRSERIFEPRVQLGWWIEHRRIGERECRGHQ